MEHQPLVSIIVITYNSANFVLDTLESIKGQTYRNIELIISDDCSRDDTVGLCNAWIVENKGAFVSAFLTSTGVNKGITGNCNNGINLAKGSWVKIIAGDDLLLSNCIADNVSHAEKNEDDSVVFSGAHTIDERSMYVGMHMRMETFFGYTQKEQLSILLNVNCLLSCTAFINRRILVNEGGFDETYPMLEDHPLWVKLLSKGYKLGYFPGKTICYRTHIGSVSNGGKKRNPVFVSSWLDFGRDVRLPLSRKISAWLYLRVKIDLILFYAREKSPVLYKALYPIAYLRAYWYYTSSKYSPFKKQYI